MRMPTMDSGDPFSCKDKNNNEKFCETVVFWRNCYLRIKNISRATMKREKLQQTAIQKYKQSSYLIHL